MKKLLILVSLIITSYSHAAPNNILINKFKIKVDDPIKEYYELASIAAAKDRYMKRKIL